MSHERRPIFAAIAAAFVLLLFASEGAAQDLTLEDAIRLARPHEG